MLNIRAISKNYFLDKLTQYCKDNFPVNTLAKEAIFYRKESFARIL